MKTIQAVNDFVIKFANVNGSGSASANELFAKAVMRMGVPVSPRNIFPSNIQGLPTWYEARICEKGYTGRRGGVDMMVAMNPQTWEADVAEIESGGYLFYDSTRPMPPSRFRDDVQVIGVPLTEIANAAYADARQRQLFKNIIYVGALSALLDMAAVVFERLFAEQYKGKERLLDSNIQALHMGRDFVLQNVAHPLGIRVKRSDRVGDQIFTDGNSAIALGCLYGGATVAAWYPITPSSSVPEAFQKYCEKFRVDPETGQHRFAIVQAEDELASIGMVVGAGWNGARAFTASLAQYRTFFAEPLYWHVFVRTALMSILATLLTLGLAFPVAWIIAKVAQGRAASLLFVVCLIPFWVSETVRTLGWMILLRESGVIPQLLVHLGLTAVPVELLYHDATILVGLVYTSMLFMVVPLITSLESLDNSLIEAAYDLGANGFAVLRTIVIPHAAPGITAGCIVVFMLTLGNYLTPTLLGGKNSQWFTEQIYTQFITRFNWEQGAAFGFLLLGLSTLIVVVGLRLSGQRFGEVMRST